MASKLNGQKNAKTNGMGTRRLFLGKKRRPKGGRRKSARTTRAKGLLQKGEERRPEEALRESEERYRSLFTSAPLAIFVCDRNGVIQQYNDRAVELWGREPVCGSERHCGSVKLWRTDGTLLPYTQSPIVEVLRTGVPALNVEVFIERPDGSRLPVLVNFAPLMDARGEISGAITSFVDITERKQAEETLRELSNELEKQLRNFDAVVSSVPDFIYSFDLSGRFTFVNQPLLDLWQKTFDEAVGKDFHDLDYPPDLAKKLQHQIQKVIRTGRPLKDETPYTSAVGERQYEYIFVPLFSLGGEVEAVAGVTRDITERKEAAAQLLALKNRSDADLAAMTRLHELTRQSFVTSELEPLLEQALDASIALHGADFGNIQIVNRRTGVLEILAQRGFDEELLNYFKRAAEWPAFRRALKKRKRIIIEDIERDREYKPHRQIARKAGYRAVQSTPLIDRSGKTLGVLSTYFRKPRRFSERELRLTDLYVRQISDMIAFKLSEADLRRREQRLARRARERTAALIAANEELKIEFALRKKLEGQLLEISDREQRRMGQDLHDSLCQHLAATAFMTRALAERVRSAKQIEPAEIDKIAGLINDGVSEARMIARGLHPVEMDAAGLMTALESLVNQENWSVPCRLDAKEEVLVTDPTVSVHLYRIAREAVINANKHARAREIVVRMRSSGKQLELSVSDNGVGIPASSAGSTGLGLHIMNYRARDDRRASGDH